MSAPSSLPVEINAVPVMMDESQKELLSCSTCLEVLHDPVRACNSNHHVCRGCLANVIHQANQDQRRPSCPECRDEVVFYWDRTGTRVPGVPAPILAAIIAAQQCACPFECGNNFKLAAFPDHKKVCANAPVECPFAALGCKHTTTRGKLNQHMEDAKNEHDLLVAENLSGTNKIISEQSKQLETAERKINMLTDELSTMAAGLRAGLDQVHSRSREAAEKQADTNKILSQICKVMEANAKSFEVAVHAKRAPKRKAGALEEASNAVKEVVASVAKICEPPSPYVYPGWAMSDMDVYD